MVESRTTRTLLRLGTWITLAFIYVPLFVIAIYAFNANISQTWPIEDYTTKWFSEAWHNEQVRDALLLSVKAGLGATAVALVLGTLASLAVARYSFFGKETISFLVILPIALPGIITGLALQATILNVLSSRSGSASRSGRSSSDTRRSASSSSTTTLWLGCAACPGRSRKHQPISEPTRGRPSAT